jgi:hypothetical protein
MPAAAAAGRVAPAAALGCVCHSRHRGKPITLIRALPARGARAPVVGVVHLIVDAWCVGERRCRKLVSGSVLAVFAASSSSTDSLLASAAVALLVLLLLRLGSG